MSEERSSWKEAGKSAAIVLTALAGLIGGGAYAGDAPGVVEVLKKSIQANTKASESNAKAVEAVASETQKLKERHAREDAAKAERELIYRKLCRDGTLSPEDLRCADFWQE